MVGESERGNISKDENVRNVDQILSRVGGKGDGSH